MEAKRRVCVTLNIYDLTASNNYVYPIGMGAFHTGIEICGKEFCFGGHEFDTTGVFACEPRNAYGAVFREAIVVGHTERSLSELQAVIDNLAEEYPGNSYNILTRNCNHFSNDACRALVGKSIPNWINRAAYVGSFVQCLLPPIMRMLAPPQALLEDGPADVHDQSSSDEADTLPPELPDHAGMRREMQAAHTVQQQQQQHHHHHHTHPSHPAGGAAHTVQQQQQQQHHHHHTHSSHPSGGAAHTVQPQQQQLAGEQQQPLPEYYNDTAVPKQRAGHVEDYARV